MKKTLNLFIILITSIFIISCSKTPFKEEEPLDGTALVYVYVMPDEGINDTNRIPYYEVEINNRYTEGKLYPYEFLKYSLDADKVKISVVRNQIEKQTLNLDIKRGNRYFLKVMSYSDDLLRYKFELVPEKQALKEIIETKYAKYEENNTPSILVDEKDKPKTVVVTKSKTQKIKEAYELKKDGIITDEEFQNLKAEILDAK